MLKLDDGQRIRALRADRWIDYPRATDALSRLQRLLDTPRRERMPCVAFVLSRQSLTCCQRITTPHGSLPTAMSEIFLLLSVSITDTLAERPHAT